MLARITKEPTLGFVEYREECNVFRLTVPLVNCVYVKDIYFNIWTGKRSYESADKTELKNIEELKNKFGYSGTAELMKQSQNLVFEVVDLLIQANKKELKLLKGMIVECYNEKGNLAEYGNKITKIKIPPQQLITINDKTYYELNECVEKMIESVNVE